MGTEALRYSHNIRYVMLCYVLKLPAGALNALTNIYGAGRPINFVFDFRCLLLATHTLLACLKANFFSKTSSSLYR